MEKMENYFKSIDCEYVVIDVFAYNNLAINFYNKQGYHTRGLIDTKKLKLNSLISYNFYSLP